MVPPEPKSPDQLLAYLNDIGLETQTHHHEPVFTVEESRQVHDRLPGMHCKNLFLKDKKQKLWLVVARHDAEIDLKALRHQIGAAHLSFGKSDLLMDVLGVSPGSVTPFALINDEERRINVVLDSIMMAAEVAYYHPLQNTMSTAISPNDLRRFIQSLGYEFNEVAL